MKFEWGWRSVPLSFCFAYYSWTRVRGVIRITWALSAERQTITVPYVTKLHRIRNKESRVVKDLDSSTQPLEGLHCLLPEVPKGFYRGGCSIQLHLAWWMTRMSDSADGSRVMTTPYVFGCSETALARYGSQSLPVADNQAGYQNKWQFRQEGQREH